MKIIRHNSTFVPDRPLPRLKPLTACLALSLGAAGAAAADGGALLPSAAPGHNTAAHFGGAGPATTLAVTHMVTTCNEPMVPPTCDGIDDGTLRKAYFCSGNNDTIDLTQLACSVITLNGTLTDGGGSYLTLKGPGKDLLRIDGGGKGRVLVHNGSGALTISDLTITNGALDNPYTYAGGGCIYSYGKVTLESSTVTSCALSTHGYLVARGGAIYAKRDATLFSSTVSGNSVFSEKGSSRGGAIYAGTVFLETSTISGNTAATGQAARGYGAGIFSTGTVTATYSTISGNSASRGGGGVYSNKLTMIDSTISGNDAFQWGGAFAGTSAAIYNSTLVKNTSFQLSGGLYTRPAGVRMESSIIALNTASGIEYDIGCDCGGTIAGTNNIIMSAVVGLNVPPDTIFDDPKLGPLKNNGGLTQTHALLTGSPAIDHGNTIRHSTQDQRLVKRVLGPSADIGAVEFIDSIFASDFDPVEIIGS